jgi:hypothetical protein
MLKVVRNGCILVKGEGGNYIREGPRSCGGPVACERID